MKSSAAKQTVLCLNRYAVVALPLAIASFAAFGASPASTLWAPTDTKAFVTPSQVEARSATPLLELAAGESAHIVVSLKLRDEAQLKQFAQAVNQPGNAQFGKFLKRQQFLLQYAPTEAQVQAVVAHLRKNGFVNIHVAPNRLLISADGSAGAVKAAFNTPLVRYQLNGKAGYANTAPAQVPQDLGEIVGSVLGLQNVARAHPMLKVGERSAAKTLAAGTAKGHNPTEFPTIYDASSAPTAANTTVGIITIGGVSQTLQDLQQFTSANGLAPVNTQTIQTGSSNGDYSDDQDGQGEWDLDSQSIVGSAGGAVQQLLFYMADQSASGNTGLTQAFNQAVSDNVAKVINVSLGWCEADANADGTLQAEDRIFSTAAAQGQTFSVSSGDEGVYECNNRGYPDGSTYSVSWPASSPNVIAVGGTTLYTTSAGAYSSETVWNEGLDSNGKLWATGGGYSVYEAKPSWQSAVSGTPSQRLLPDISFDAAQSTGALIYNYGQLQQIGGTSLASPIFVGLWARLQTANSNSLGFPAASFYSAISSTPSLVHDVKSGNNGYGGYGYKAATGWDYPTGWGSLDIAKLSAYIKSNGFAH